VDFYLKSSLPEIKTLRSIPLYDEITYIIDDERAMQKLPKYDAWSASLNMEARLPEYKQEPKTLENDRSTP